MLHTAVADDRSTTSLKTFSVSFFLSSTIFKSLSNQAGYLWSNVFAYWETRFYFCLW